MAQDYIISSSREHHGSLITQLVGMIAYNAVFPFSYADETNLVLEYFTVDSAPLTIDNALLRYKADSTIYKDVEFDKTGYFTIGVVHTENAPNYAHIRERTDSPNFIAITWNDQDQNELLLNSYFRWVNIANDDKGKTLENSSTHTKWLALRFRQLFGIDFTSGDEITVDQLKSLILAESGYKSQYVAKQFYEPNFGTVPDDLTSRFLVLKYSDLFVKNSDGSYPTLNSILAFTGGTINDALYKNYDDFAAARLTFINKWAPWILTA